MHHQTSPKSLQRGRRINPQLLQSVRLPLQFFRQVKGCGIQTCTAVVCLAILRTNVDNHSCLLGVQESLMGLHMPCHAMQQWPNTSCWRVTAQQGPGSQGMKTCVACQADTCRQSLPFVRGSLSLFPPCPWFTREENGLYALAHNTGRCIQQHDRRKNRPYVKLTMTTASRRGPVAWKPISAGSTRCAAGPQSIKWSTQRMHQGQ